MVSTTRTAFAVIFGILYWIFGISMIVSSLIPGLGDRTGQYMIPMDPAAGFVLCVVGTVFLFAYKNLARGMANGQALLCVGMGLSLVFGIVALLSLLATGVDLVLFGDGELWNPVQLLVPMVWLAILPAIGLYAWGQDFISNLVGA